MDGRKVKTTMRFLNSNKLVQEERDPSSGKFENFIQFRNHERLFSQIRKTFIAHDT